MPLRVRLQRLQSPDVARVHLRRASCQLCASCSAVQCPRHLRACRLPGTANPARAHGAIRSTHNTTPAWSGCQPTQGLAHVCRQVSVGASSLLALPQSHRRLGLSLQGVTVAPLGPTIGAAECGAARDGTIPFSPGHAAGAASGRHLKQLLFVPNIGVSQATPPAIDAMLHHLQVRHLCLGEKAVSKMTVVPDDSEQGRTEDHFCGARKPLSHAVSGCICHQCDRHE